MKLTDVIRRPLITEKTSIQREQDGRTIVFHVAVGANKTQIKRAIESLFSVRVTAVHTMNVRGKMRRRGKDFGYTADWKKAVVTLASGDQIELFEGV